jgi:hypothetical protein
MKAPEVLRSADISLLVPTLNQLFLSNLPTVHYLTGFATLQYYFLLSATLIYLSPFVSVN